MQFVPSVDFVMPHPQVQAKLYDALELLRVCVDKLGDAVDGYDQQPAAYSDCLRSTDLLEAQCTANLHATILQEIIGGVAPTLPDSVFQAVRDFENREPANVPHIEGSILGLKLACRALDDAMALSAKLDGIEIDEAYELMLPATAAIGYFASLLDGVVVPFYCREVLDAILSGGPVPSKKELHDHWIKRRFPNGIPAHANLAA